MPAALLVLVEASGLGLDGLFLALPTAALLSAVLALLLLRVGRLDMQAG